jgi:hypothetical protein
MVIRLGESLGLPLRERNDFLLKAGFAPAYPENPLDGSALAPARAALDHILTAHLPFPAIIIDRRGTLIAANAGQRTLFEGCAPELLAPPANAYRIALHPDGMAPRITNLAEWGRHILHAMAAELERGPDARLAAVAEELSEYVPQQALQPGSLGFAVPLQLRSARGELRLMTTITSFATAVDVTLSELKLEAFLPADQLTADVLLSEHRARDGESGEIGSGGFVPGDGRRAD